MQRTIPHGIWIDLLPHGRMRDNALGRVDLLQSNSLCDDLMGGLYEGKNTVEEVGMLVWSDPWTVDGWEMTEGFVRKWGFLVRDCWELMTATNRWRTQRGEEPMDFEALII